MNRCLAILLLVATPFLARAAVAASAARADPHAFDMPTLAGLAFPSTISAHLLTPQCGPPASPATFVPVIDPIAGRVFDAASASPSTCPAGVSAPSPGYHQACGLSPLGPSALQVALDLNIAVFRRLDIGMWQVKADGRLREWLCGDVLYMVVVRQSGPPTLIDVVWGIMPYP